MTRDVEDVLRDALRREADAVHPAGSFADVRARRRALDRRATAVRAMAAVLVVAAASTLLTVLARQPGSDDLDVVAPPPDTTAGVGIWPYATSEQADAAGDGPAEPAGVAQGFLDAVAGSGALRVEDAEVSGDRATVVAVAGDARRRTTVTVERIGASRRWTVVAARADGLVIDAPEPAAAVTTPLTVSGRVTAFEGTVLLDVVSAGRSPVDRLGTAVATAAQGELQPFRTDLDFRAGDGAVVAVVALTTSAQDGSVEQVAAVPVRPQPGADGGLPRAAGDGLAVDEIVAVVTAPREGDPDDQEVVVVGPHGERRRTLYTVGTAEGGVLGLAVTGDRRTVLLTEATSACESRLVALRSDGHGGPVPFGTGEALALSPDGTRLAVGVDPDCDGHHTLEIRDLDGGVLDSFGDGATSTAGLPTTVEEGYGARVQDIAWVDDGTIVYEVQLEDGLALYVLDLARIGRDERLRRGDDPAVLWHAPARDASGRLTVVESTLDRRRTPQAEAVILLDLDRGSPEAGPELAPLSGHVRSHLWRGGTLLWVEAGGRLLEATTAGPHALLDAVVRAAG